MSSLLFLPLCLDIKKELKSLTNLCLYHKQWTDKIADKRYLVFFLGNHYPKNFPPPNDPFGLFAVAIRNIHDYLEQGVPRADRVVYFVTTPPGHDRCHTYQSPLAAPLANMHNHERYTMWRSYYRFNDVLKNLVRALNSSRYRVLDVYPFSVLRPDAHVSAQDCLHYCHPGPTDWWNVALGLDMLYRAWS